ncbi:MAG: metallophosphoesterase [Eubacteriales bacterium]
MKKILCLSMVISLLLAMFIPAFATDGTTARPMRFNTDGSFKILQITDLHKSDDDVYEDVNTCLLRKLAVSQNPDLVVITGDITMSGTKEQIIGNVSEIMTAFGDYSIPVAVVFGNHDSESGVISREDLMAVYNSHANSISVDDGNQLPGCGTYNIPILSSGSDKMAFNLWMIDSREYDAQGRYGCVTKEQIDWYIHKSSALKAQNNGKAVNSLMFQHIIVPEIYDALLEANALTPYAVKKIYDDKYFVLNPKNTNAGRLAEYPCPPYFNNGQFDAIVSQGDVLAMFFGHDHSNTFNIKYKGVDLVATPKTNFQGISGIDHGARLITLNEADTSKYSTKLVPFSSLYDDQKLNLGTIFSQGFDFKSIEFKTMSMMKFYSVIYKVEYFFATTLAELFTGTKFDYR